jgi:hypothetical protein
MPASPLRQGERTKVRGSKPKRRLSEQTLTLPLSLAKGEATHPRAVHSHLGSDSICNELTCVFKVRLTRRVRRDFRL